MEKVWYYTFIGRGGLTYSVGDCGTGLSFRLLDVFDAIMFCCV